MVLVDNFMTPRFATGNESNYYRQQSNFIVLDNEISRNLMVYFNMAKTDIFDNRCYIDLLIIFLLFIMKIATQNTRIVV